MVIRHVGTAVALVAAAVPVDAQDIAYRSPPDVIREILDAPPTPAVLPAPDGRTLVLLGSPGMPDIAELAQPVLGLAGVRINPRTNGPARSGRIDALTFLDVASGTRRDVELPNGAHVSHVTWSPDGEHLAFANTVDHGIELWVADARSARARRIMEPVLNAAIGSPFVWMPDGVSLLVRRLMERPGAPPSASLVPDGPVIREAGARSIPVRTFTDLLENTHNEALFDFYFTGQLVRQPIDGSAAAPIGEPGIIASFSVAPGGEHLLVTRIQRPYGYAVNVWSFGSRTDVFDMRSNRLLEVDNRVEITLPPRGRDVVRPGRRIVHWRADAPATLVWVEAADGGDPTTNSAVRDRVFMLDAPFTGTPRALIDLPGRYAGIDWANDTVALVHSRRAAESTACSWVIDPSAPGTPPRLLHERSTEDRYAHPGTPVTRTDIAGYDVLRMSNDARAFYTTGIGASPRGNYPFLDRVDLATGAAERLWQAEDPYYEYVATVLDDNANRFITRRESQQDPANYYIRDRIAGSLDALTSFTDPAPQLAGIQRRLITYQRADGVMLSATLLTPPDYDAQRDGPLPMLMWAYPREYRDTAAAGQVSGSANRFSRPAGLSHLFLLTQGYAILDGPAMPIIGGNGIEPNDSFVDQLVASARAAVDEVVAMGVADPDRIAIAGHSYGAFMAANLLAHTDLFHAGIALSGAYNRTLTPFGFQLERRSYWDATDVYDAMSPFNHADRIDAPLLLVHGDADSNPGTYPMQSERMYLALAGLGATVRFVSLPYEGHSYVARQSVLHVLAEIVDWLGEHFPDAEPDF